LGLGCRGSDDISNEAKNSSRDSNLCSNQSFLNGKMIESASSCHMSIGFSANDFRSNLDIPSHKIDITLKMDSFGKEQVKCTNLGNVFWNLESNRFEDHSDSLRKMIVPSN